MPNTNNILLLLNIQDKFVTLTDNSVNKVYSNSGDYHLEVGVKYFRKPHRCTCCGKSSGFIVKDYKTMKVNWLNSSGVKTIVNLTKTRWKCNQCNKTTTPSPSFINPRNRIANHVKHMIALELTKPTSLKDIAQRYHVSVNTVIRILLDHYNSRSYIFRRKLPEVLLFDEFKSTKYSTNYMSFVYLDGAGNLIDIVESRKLNSLRSYFQKYDIENRKKVKYISIDMYEPYISLIKEVFPNATIVFDKFHVVQHITRAMNKTRIRIMNGLPKTSRHKKALKDNWKLILKNRSDITDYSYRSYRVFQYNQYTTTSFIDEMISIDKELKETYELYQYLLNSIHCNNVESFNEALNFIKENMECSHELKRASSKFIKDNEYVTNCMLYKYNTGKVEGTINLIKQLKRNAFGYKSFFNFKLRILVRFNIIQVKKS